MNGVFSVNTTQLFSDMKWLEINVSNSDQHLLHFEDSVEPYLFNSSIFDILCAWFYAKQYDVICLQNQMDYHQLVLTALDEVCIGLTKESFKRMRLLTDGEVLTADEEIYLPEFGFFLPTCDVAPVLENELFWSTTFCHQVLKTLFKFKIV